MENLAKKFILNKINELKKKLNETRLALNEVDVKSWKYYNNYEEYRKLDDMELMEYMFLIKFKTKLPVDIYVDDGGAYVRHKHILWLYFDNNYNDNPKNVLPLTISNNPVIPLGRYKLNISKNDYDEIVQFVKDNVKILTDLANHEMSQREFFDALTDYKLKIRKPLNEMATMTPDETGLPVNIWLDENNLNLPHAQRIKFKSRNDQDSTYKYTSMTISKEPEIINMPRNPDISPKEVKLIQEFVRLNEQLLLQLCLKKIDYFQDFVPNMIRLDRNGNPIQPPKKQEYTYEVLGKYQYGFVVVRRNDGLFNFQDRNNQILFQSYWFNEVTPFQEYNDGTIYATVRLDDTWYYLYPNGDSKRINLNNI